MKNIQNDIKNKEFKSVYLIYGSETYLKTNCKKKLKSSIVGDDTMNYNYFEGKNINTKEVIDICETLPFFDDKRLVIMENTGFFKKSQEDITDYIDEIPESTIIVFVEDEIDKRNRLYKKVKSNGYVCDISTQKESDLERWVLGLIGREHKKITKETLTLFLETVGPDMETISKEIEKLLCYTLEKQIISNDDVLQICTERIEVKIFDLFSAMSSGNQTRTMEIYHDLVENKEPLMRIMFMLVKQFSQLIAVKDLANRGFSKKEIAGKLSMRSDWVVQQLQRQGSRYSMEQLKTALEECAGNEEAVKTGNLDEKMAVEMILVKYSKNLI